MAGITINKANSFHPSFKGLKNNSSAKLLILAENKKKVIKYFCVLNMYQHSNVINKAFP